MAALPIGINTYSYIYTHSALDCMLHLAGQGYRRFEILVTPPHFWVPDLDPSQRRDIPRILAERDLAITSINLPSLDGNLVAPTPELRRFTIDTFHGIIDVAGEWGVPNIIVIPGKLSAFLPPPADWLKGWLAEALAEMADHAEKAGVRLLIENVSAAYLPTTGEILAALDEIGDPRIGVIYDVANAVFSGEDPAEWLPKARERLHLVHLSDTRTDRWRHVPVGTGVVDFKGVAETLRAIGYDGPSMLEIVSPTPDADIAESRRLLAQWGWEGPAE